MAWSDTLILTGLTIIVAIRLVLRRRNHLHLPPGPRGLPIVGNLFQVNPLRLYVQFHAWAKQYGEIFSVRFGAQTIVVLNTPEAAQELLVNRGTRYASRSPPHVAHDIVSAGQRMIFMPYGAEYNTVRRSLNSAIGSGPSKNVRKFQDLESRVLLHDLMCYGGTSIAEPQAAGEECPEGHWFAIIRRYSLSLVMNIMYGKRVYKIQNDAPLQKVFDVVANITRISQPGNYLADVCPILRLLPDFLAPWRISARELHVSQAAPRPRGYVSAYMRARAEAGNTDAPGLGLTDDEWMRDVMIAYAAGGVIEAGAETTAGTLQAAILLLLANPHILARAREELDGVVGPDRLPQFEDEEKLPYIVACAKETMRRRPLIVTGYHIPKGTTAIGNVWAMHMDEERFPDPLAFVPERFLDSACEQYTFGWGRRACQGRSIAEASLFIVLARILWAFELYAPVLPDLADESTKGAWGDRFVSKPQLFGVAFAPRAGREGIVKAAYEETQREWEVMGLELDER